MVRLEVTSDEVADGLDARDGACLKSARSKVILHQSADGVPFGWANSIGEASVRDYLDMAVGHLHVYKDTIICRRVPHS